MTDLERLRLVKLVDDWNNEYADQRAHGQDAAAQVYARCMKDLLAVIDKS